MNINISNKNLYLGLIITFITLYVCVGFVSTLHAITFFQLANSTALAFLLALCFELGQSTVLFSLLMSKNNEKVLPWALMILLTALQISANVFASFKHIILSGSNDWIYWQKTILFGLQAQSPEMYQVIIAYIQGALLPIVALGMISLVANNINLILKEHNKPEENIKDKNDDPKHINDISQDTPELNKSDNNIDPITKNHLLNDNWKEELENEVELMTPENLDINKEEDNKEEDEISKDEIISQKEEIKKVKKRTRIIDPLKKKSKIKRIKNLDEINPVSKGDEVIALIENEEKNKVKESINSDIKIIQDIPELNSDSSESNKSSYVENSGVEVIDAKAIPYKRTFTKKALDKFGIPILPGEHKNFDKI